MYPRGLHQPKQRKNNGISQIPGGPPKQQSGASRIPMPGMVTQSQPKRSPGVGGISSSVVDTSRQRKITTDKIIADCYSKVVIDKNGRKYTDASYQTHVGIKEYSSFPTQPPPENLTTQQVGSIKDRILVVCVKHTGRVLIQKGKFNSSKNLYQIGRTWDMDELKKITRVGNDGIILSLNKDYYWRIDEGLERVWKFARFLAQSFGGFMGRYPALNGFSLTDFKLPHTPEKKVGSRSSYSEPTHKAAQKTSSTPTVGSGLAAPSKVNAGANANINANINATSAQAMDPNANGNIKEHYKDFDFTSNGKLPSKPMRVMQTDRSSDSAANVVPAETPGPNSKSERKRVSHPYQEKAYNKSEDTIPDTSSFVFKTRDAYSPEKLHEYVETDEQRSGSPLRNYKPRTSATEVERKVSEPLDSAATLGFSLENQLSERKLSSSELANLRTNRSREEHPVSTGSNRTSLHSFKHTAMNSDASEFIEESTKLEDDSMHRDINIDKFEATEGMKSAQEGVMKSRNSMEGRPVSSVNDIDTSIQEIEEFMDSQLDFGAGGDKSYTEISRDSKRASNASSKLIARESRGERNDGDEKVFESYQGNDTAENDEEMEEPTEGLNLAGKDNIDSYSAKDPELEEILEDVGWKLSDNSDIILKKLSKERNKVKHQNIKHLVEVDLKDEASAKDFATSINEVESLGHIFMKMGINFKFLSNDINTIEVNSQGLQVTSVNKNILYNDLKSILDKVSIGKDELMLIRHFKDFDRLGKLEPLEVKLANLYNALSTFQNDSVQQSDDLSSMSALKQYQVNYLQVAQKFGEHFVKFFEAQFDILVTELTKTVDTFYPSAMFRELNSLLIYSSLTYFLKDLSPDYYRQLGDFVNRRFGELLRGIITYRINHLNYSSSSLTHQNTGLSPSSRSRSLRFSRKDKLLSKSSGTKGERATTEEPLSIGKKSKTIDDIKTVMSLIEDSKVLIGIFQFFIGELLHYSSSNLDFIDYINEYPYQERRRNLEVPSIEKAAQKSYSNSIISTLNLVFGSYINTFIKSINPTETNIPTLVVFLDKMIDENQSSNQEFLVFNFLRKVGEKFKEQWFKIIKTQTDLLNRSTIVAKSGVLASVKNIGQLIVLTESNLESVQVGSEVTLLLNSSYNKISEAVSHFFNRDDPLLKSHEFDDKEKDYRNVSVIQNVFYLKEQLSVTGSARINGLLNHLQSIFNNFKESYFHKLLSKNIGKLVEFVDNYEALGKLNNGKPKKYNKKYVKSLLSSYTHKDVTSRVQEIYRKLEKHFLTGQDTYERDLLDNLWIDMEKDFVGYFSKLNGILRTNFDKDIETVSPQEVHSIFKATH